VIKFYMWEDNSGYPAVFTTELWAGVFNTGIIIGFSGIKNILMQKSRKHFFMAVK